MSALSRMFQPVDWSYRPGDLSLPPPGPAPAPAPAPRRFRGDNWNEMPVGSWPAGVGTPGSKPAPLPPPDSTAARPPAPELPPPVPVRSNKPGVGSVSDTAYQAPVESQPWAIAPGASDLADASGQLAKLGLSGRAGVPPVDWSSQVSMAPWATEQDRREVAAAMANRPPVDFGGGPGNAPVSMAPWATEQDRTDLNRDMRVAPSAETLEMRRRRAFLDAPDSLEGMRRARLVMADAIEAGGGDVQQLAADAKLMRPASMKQLESWHAQQQGGGRPGVESGSGAIGVAAAGVEPGEMPARFDGYAQALTQQAAAKAAAEGYYSSPVSTAYEPQVIPAGAPDGARLAALAAAGEHWKLGFDQAQQDMYSAQNGVVLGLSTPKRGATVNLGVLDDAEVSAFERMNGRRKDGRLYDRMPADIPASYGGRPNVYDWAYGGGR